LCAMDTVILDPDDPTRGIVGSHSEASFGAYAGMAVIEKIHPESKCSGRRCVVHNPSEHGMRQWQLHWRDDRGIFERMCPAHGVGHPDPDQFQFWRETGQAWQGVHGCCGCCKGIR
jgi:hypothetical protein